MWGLQHHLPHFTSASPCFPCWSMLLLLCTILGMNQWQAREDQQHRTTRAVPSPSAWSNHSFSIGFFSRSNASPGSVCHCCCSGLTNSDEPDGHRSLLSCCSCRSFLLLSFFSVASVCPCCCYLQVVRPMHSIVTPLAAWNDSIAPFNFGECC